MSSRLDGVVSARFRTEALGLDVPFFFNEAPYSVGLSLGGVLGARARRLSLGLDFALLFVRGCVFCLSFG